MKHEYEFEDRLLARIKRECHFGITEIGALIAGLATSAGVGATTAGIIGTVGAGALGGAALGAGSSALMGKDPGKGALFGGLTGGALGAAGPIAEGLGVGGSALGTAAVDVAAGAAGGAAGGEITGMGAGKGAVIGAAGGALQGASSALSAPAAGTAPGAAPAAAGPSAATTAAPASVAAAGPDLTAPLTEAVTVTAPAAAAAGGVGAAGAAVGGAAAGGGDGAGGGKPTDKGSLAGQQTPGAVGNGAASGQPSLTSGVNTTSNLAPGGGNLTPQVGNMKPLSINDAAASGPTTLAGADTAAAAGPGATGLDAATLASAPTTSVGQFVADPSLKTGLNVLDSNANLLLAAGGLGYNALQGNKKPEGIAPIQAQAQHDVASGNMLQGYLASGTLPPGMQANIDASTKAAEAAIRQRYANMGMPGSSAEAQDIQAARMAAVGQAADMRTKLYSAGVTQSGLGTDLYNELLKINMQQDENLSTSIGNFVSSFAGLDRPNKVKPNSATGAA